MCEFFLQCSEKRQKSLLPNVPRLLWLCHVPCEWRKAVRCQGVIVIITGYETIAWHTQVFDGGFNELIDESDEKYEEYCREK